MRSLRKLERLLGVSQGYLSKLRAGTNNPSPELTLLLGLLASNPEADASTSRRILGRYPPMDICTWR